MITCQTYTFREDGRQTISLTLPCFSGIGSSESDCVDDFYAAARMNRFYGHTANEIYRYAMSFSDSDVRRMTFICRTDASIADDGTVKVTLTLTLRRVLANESCPTLTKQLTHYWRDGLLIKNHDVHN